MLQIKVYPEKYIFSLYSPLLIWYTKPERNFHFMIHWISIMVHYRIGYHVEVYGATNQKETLLFVTSMSNSNF